MMDLILASKSAARHRILTKSRIPFTSIEAKIDEDSITRSLIAEGAPLRDIPDTLAELKAQKISNRYPNALVLGYDQILVFDGKPVGKPKSKEDLDSLFQKISGEKHNLITANVIYQNGKPLWRHVGIVSLTMRKMTQEDIRSYIENNWDDVRHCAGGYLFEKTPSMFSSARGNWFDIMGLSIHQVASFLNQHNPHENFSAPKLAAVLGHPIAHSKSPKLHGAWLDRDDISGDYLALDLPPQHFETSVKMLISLGFVGFNVTLPHKEAALSLADLKTDIAEKIGAANTLMIDPAGSITATNTDGYGFMKNLMAGCPNWNPKEGTALVLGAGGAARAILVSLIDARVPKIILSNRTKEKADQLAQEFGETIEVVDWQNRSEHVETASTIVNTTALGMVGERALEIDLSRVQPGTLVTDLVYTPLETELLRVAKSNGCRVVPGLGMLLHQGVPGFQSWFGGHAVVDDALERLILA